MEKYEKAPIEEAIEDVEAFLVFMADWPPDIGPAAGCLTHF